MIAHSNQANQNKEVSCTLTKSILLPGLSVLVCDGCEHFDYGAGIRTPLFSEKVPERSK